MAELRPSIFLLQILAILQGLSSPCPGTARHNLRAVPVPDEFRSSSGEAIKRRFPCRRQQIEMFADFSARRTLALDAHQIGSSQDCESIVERLERPD